MKIIAMSGGSTFGNLDYLKPAEKFGADRSISKPFRLHEIKAMVDDLLGLSPQTDGNGDSTS
ncbi:MAG TPA: hypothetical protein EYQ50_05295 [Verrucomicrobiales bacterium]|jgi:hypothetical protein|nr:hypothetical protein [Verrucomicrobiales bacterium]HIL69416.1 hypothetical protein [Verrucomicrobiota bacterium]